MPCINTENMLQNKQGSMPFSSSFMQSKYIIYWVRDDDSLVSDTTKYAIFVRLAPPVLWGDGSNKDTLWVPVDTLTKAYYIQVYSYDTNGINNLPMNWYWNSIASLTGATVTQKDSLSISFTGVNPFPIGIPQIRYIYARDNDSLLRGGQFVVYADSAPPTPLTTVDKPTGQIRIGWIGKDAKDGNGTLFKIIMKKGSAPAITDTLIDFTSGISLSPGLNGYDFSYTFIPSGGNGTYYYQVIAKDARGATSFSSASFFNFP